MMILVIEDNRLLCESICDLLHEHGFATEAAYDGDAGLEFALTGVYDLIVLDVMLPGWTALPSPGSCAAGMWARPS